MSENSLNSGSRNLSISPENSPKSNVIQGQPKRHYLYSEAQLLRGRHRFFGRWAPALARRGDRHPGMKW
jgi:hypothetical protein